MAQINIGTMRAPTDDPIVAEFMDNLDRINARADSAAGFVWRLQTDDGNATAIQIFTNPLQLVNMSVWESIATLKDYVYRTEHVEFFRRRAEWFEADAKRVALWWVAAGSTPELDEAVPRVELLEARGPSAYAFGFAAPPATLVLEPTDIDDADTAQLLSRIDHEVAAGVVDSTPVNGSSARGRIVGGDVHLIRARYEGAVVGCGALLHSAPGIGTIERLFVERSVRGRRIGAALLDQIELRATRLQLDELRIETGALRPEAISLFESAGYVRCEAPGECVERRATSVCYGKALVRTR